MMVDSKEMFDPIAGPSSSGCYWTTVNVGEAVQGIATPLTASWYNHAGELGLRCCFADLGVLSAGETPMPPSPDDRFMYVFFGRQALNVDTWRHVGDLLPGSSGDAIEKQFFGAVRPGVTSNPSKRRYPVIAVKFPLALYRKQKIMKHLRAITEPWWQDAIRQLEGGDPDVARRLLADAFNRFNEIMRHHVASSMLAQSIYEQIGKLAKSAGHPGLELSLSTGYGSLEESAVLAQLWELVKQGRDVTPIAAKAGYYGVNTGELSARCWREDPGALISLANRFMALPEEQSPEATDKRQQQKRREAAATLLDALSPAKRVVARILLKLASVYLPLRETGRATILMPGDVGRAAARVIGTSLQQAGRLDSADDIFMFTQDEVLRDEVHRDVAAFRRQRLQYYAGVELPEAWQGIPQPRNVQAEAAREVGSVVLTGLGANPGLVEGRVRVIHEGDDLDDAEIEPGEIMVCRTTDPAWAPLFLVAGAVVIDIGGPLSHGAIVARELGLPCVIGTKDGSKRLRTGDLVRVDGQAGRVERID